MFKTFASLLSGQASYSQLIFQYNSQRDLKIEY